jgi:hypothetical protein
VEHRPQERPAQERRPDAGIIGRMARPAESASAAPSGGADAIIGRLARTARPAESASAAPSGGADAIIGRLARTAQPAVKARPAAGFGVSYSHWIPGRAAVGQLGFPARDRASRAAAAGAYGFAPA